MNHSLRTRMPLAFRFVLPVIFAFCLGFAPSASATATSKAAACDESVGITVKTKRSGRWRPVRLIIPRSELASEDCPRRESGTRIPLGLDCRSPLRMRLQYQTGGRWKTGWAKLRTSHLLTQACADFPARNASRLLLATGKRVNCKKQVRYRAHNESRGADSWIAGRAKKVLPKLCGIGGSRSTPPARVQCSDGVDNDGDGLIDLEDGGCASLADRSEAGNGGAPGDDGSDDGGGAPGDDTDDDGGAPTPAPPAPDNPPTGDYYVRADGGTPSECNGRHDQPAEGNKPNCAWANPLHALNPIRIGEGSNLFIGGGEYEIGFGVPEVGDCPEIGRWNCGPQPLPAGVTIAGDCSNVPKLIGIERVSSVLRLDKSHNSTVKCLEITDGAECTQTHNGSHPSDHRCRRDKAPFGPWSPTGIIATDSTDVILDRVNVHGMANRCVRAGALKDWTIKSSRFVGCGRAGWDGDIPGRDDESNAGTIHFVDSEISWNGCIESLSGSNYFGCFAQTKGGYGDGLGTAATRGHWIFERVRVEYNTSDGLDLLYLNRHGVGGSFEVRDSWLAHNAGSQLKVHTGGVVENNVIIGNCANHGRFPDMLGGDLCRAGGNALSISGLHWDDDEVVVVNNTMAGHGDCLTVTPSPGGTVRYIDNIFQGGPEYRVQRNGRRDQVCGHFCSPDKCQGINLQFDGNVFWKVKHDQCIGANRVCADPMLRDPSLDTFDPALQPGSPAQGKGYRG